ncbi:hypothetical protein ACTFIU_000722 [Dictyostelium citrinum]
MKLFLIIYLIICSFLKINAAICNFTNVNKNTVIDLNPLFNLIYPSGFVFRSYVGSFQSEIFFNLCTNTRLIWCDGVGFNACQKLSSGERFHLGYFYSNYFNFDNLQIRYKSDIESGASSTCYNGYEQNKRVTDFFFYCNHNVQDLIFKGGSGPQICYYQILMEGKMFCDCGICNKPHHTGVCYNGNCQCDQFTIGKDCETLNIKIDSIISTTIIGGIGYLIGDFQFLVSHFDVLVSDKPFAVGKLINSTTIEILVQPWHGKRTVTITDGNSSYLSPILFEFINVPCFSDCSNPHGECDLFVGVCKCDGQTMGKDCRLLKIEIDSIISTTINGGIGYLIGDFKSITSSFDVFVRGLPYESVNLINGTAIEIIVLPGEGFKNVTITDGISSYLSPILFEYINVPCLYNCSQPHGVCNLFEGICTCDNQTKGNGCQSLNIFIDSIISTTINGGIGYLIGDFNFITLEFQVNIGESLCTNVKLINASTIEMLIPSGEGIKNVTITDGISSYRSLILFEYINVPCLYNCSQPHGQCNLFEGVCTCDSQTNGTGCENNRIYLDSIDPTDENGGTTYLYGYFGNTTSSLLILIDDSNCNNIQQINETLIQCDVGAGTGFKDVLLQDRDLQVKVEKLFQYFVPITTNSPKQCLNDCGGPNQGICLPSTGCSCISPWIGNDCMSKLVVISQPALNYSDPLMEIPLFESINNTNNEIENKLFISLISIVKLREIDINSKEVTSFTFRDWEFNKVNSETSRYKTDFTNSGLTTNITVTLQWFNNESIIEFGNQFIVMHPSSIKYTIEISEYKFTSKLNQLQLIMKASISVNKTDEICSDKEFGETSNGDDSNYLKVQVDNHSLYGRFIKRALIDSIPRSVDNVQLDSSMNTINSAYQSQSFIGISVPFFKKQIIIDPDFSILVGSPSKSENSVCTSIDSNIFSNTKIAAIVIGGFLGIAIISTITTYSYYKKKHDRNVLNEIRLKLTTKKVDIIM